MKKPMTPIESLHRLTEAAETAKADIAPTYAEYIQLAFAVATDCGEAGRSLFHRLCALSPKYDSRHAERTYTNALATHNGSVHLGTAFHLARLAGVETGEVPSEALWTGNVKSAKSAVSAGANFASRAQAPYYKRKEEAGGADEEETAVGSRPAIPLPTFGEASWPDLLQRAVVHGDTPARRDALLLGMLAVLGATMAKHVRCLYSGRYQHPNLQLFVVGPAASGKGTLALARLLAEPLHNEIRAQVEAEMEVYRKEKAAYDVAGRERAKMEPPKRPGNRMFLIAGNNTGTGILENIMDSGGVGLIFETEADTLSTAIGSDHGHWGDTLRKAFDHDRLAYNRRTDREYREVTRSYLSVVLSGTPAQVQPLIPSAENGLFSRQLFYYLPAVHAWEDQFGDRDTDLAATFRAFSAEWQAKLSLLREHGMHTLRLTQEQQQAFNGLFADLFRKAGLADGGELTGTVVRLAINLCRLLSVVAVLRALEHPDPYAGGALAFTPAADTPADNLKDGIVNRWDIGITDADFHAVLALAEPLYRHAGHVLSFLPATEVRRRTNVERDAFFAELDENFTRRQLLEKAAELGLKSNTVTSWLTRLVRKGELVRQDDGSYTRVRV